jgi:hypothetical protein
MEEEVTLPGSVFLNGGSRGDCELVEQCSKLPNTSYFCHCSVVVEGRIHNIDDGVAHGWIARWWGVDELGVPVTNVVAASLVMKVDR